MKNTIFCAIALALLINSFQSNAGLIELADVSDGSISEGYSVYAIENNDVLDYFSIQSRSTYIYKNTFGEIFWNINLSEVTSITFDWQYLGDTSFSTAKVMLDDVLLWSSEANNSNFTYTSIDLSPLQLSSVSKLRFINETNFMEETRIDLIGGRDSQPDFQFKNVNLLTHTEVPEPSSIVLLLLAMTFVARKQWLKAKVR